MPSSVLSDSSYQSLASEYENEIMTLPPTFNDLMDDHGEDQLSASSVEKKRASEPKKQDPRSSKERAKPLIRPKDLQLRSEPKDKRRKTESQLVNEILYKPRSKERISSTGKLVKPKSPVRARPETSKSNKSRDPKPQRSSSSSPKQEGSEEGQDSSSNQTKTPASSRRPSESTIKSEAGKEVKAPPTKVSKPLDPNNKSLKPVVKPIQDVAPASSIDTRMANLTIDLLFDQNKRKDPSEEPREQYVQEEEPEQGEEEEEEGQDEGGEEGTLEALSEGLGTEDNGTVAEGEVQVDVDGPEKPVENNPQEQIQVPARTTSEKLDDIATQRDGSGIKVQETTIGSSAPASRTSSVDAKKPLRTTSSASSTQSGNPKVGVTRMKTKEQKNEEEKQKLKDEYKKFNPLEAMEADQLNEQESKRLKAKKREIKWFLYNMQTSGIPVSKEYTYDDDLEDMKFEAKKLKDQWNLTNTSRSTWTLFMTANKIIEIILQKIDPEETEWSKWTSLVEGNRKQYMASIRSIHRKKLGYYESNPKIKLFRDFGTQAASFFGPLVLVKLLRWGKKKEEVVAPAPVVESNSGINEKVDKMESILAESAQQQQSLAKQFEDMTQMFKVMIMSQHRNQTLQQQPQPVTQAPQKPSPDRPKAQEYDTTFEESKVPPKYSFKDVQVSIPRDVFRNPFPKPENQEQQQPKIVEIPLNENREEQEEPETESEIEFQIVSKREEDENDNEMDQEGAKQEPVGPTSQLDMPYLTASAMRVPSSDSLFDKKDTQAPPAQPNQGFSMENMMKIDPNTTINSPHIQLMQGSLGKVLSPILTHLRNSKAPKKKEIPDDLKAYTKAPTPPDSESEESGDTMETNTTVQL